MPFIPQELKDLNARIKAFEEIARIEDRLRALENRKRPRSELSKSDILSGNPTTTIQLPARDSRNPSSYLEQSIAVCPSIELGNSDSSSSNTVVYPCYKCQCFARGIKVAPSYTLKVSSSLRE